MSKFFICLILSSLFSYISGTPKKISCPSSIVQWEDKMESELKELQISYCDIIFKLQTNYTEENQEKFKKAVENYRSWINQEEKKSKDFSNEIDKCKDKKAQRVLNKFFLEAVKTPEDENVSKKLTELQKNIENIRKSVSIEESGKNLTFDAGVVPFLKTTRNYSKLEKVWIDYHNNVSVVKENFTEITNIFISAIENHNYSNLDQVWKLIRYENESIDLSMKLLMSQVRPLYEQLHAYVRHKLTNHYQKEKINITEKFGRYLPVHILGDAFGQNWVNIYDLVVPYPRVKDDYNITQLLNKKNYNVTQIAKLAENFFISLGFDPMPPNFWKNSIFEKPENADPKTFLCNIGAYDMHQNNDYRIKICGKVDENTFMMMHFLMGHVVYFRAYKNQSAFFTGPANSAFLFAFSEAVLLSINTKNHLLKIGLLDEKNENKETDKKLKINKLMKKALFNIPLIPFAYSLETWRTKVFTKEIDEDQYNEQWWKIRKENSGIVPPQERNKNDLFDAGSKYHITAFTDYRKFFFGFIAQFQFYQSLCKKNKPLDECDFYGNKEGGKKLMKLMTPGISEPWPKLLNIFTGRKEFNSKALLDYYKPLSNYLKNYNKKNNIIVGWESSPVKLL